VEWPVGWSEGESPLSSPEGRPRPPVRAACSVVALYRRLPRPARSWRRDTPRSRREGRREPDSKAGHFAAEFWRQAELPQHRYPEKYPDGDALAACEGVAVPRSRFLRPNAAGLFRAARRAS